MSGDCEKTKQQKECDKVVIFVEQSFWEKLNFWTKLRTKFHLMICKNCSSYEKDSILLHRILCYKGDMEKVKPLDETEKARLKRGLS